MLCKRNPSKAAVEISWMVYFLIWSAVVTYVMASGLGSYWEDPGLMSLGVGLWLGTWLVPYMIRNWIIDRVACQWPFNMRWTEQEQEYARRHFCQDLFTSWVGVTTLSFGLNYLMTPFFFDALHMHYGFKATWTIERNPLFLYFMTVAYFSSYCALGSCVYRRFTWRRHVRSNSIGKTGSCSITTTTTRWTTDDASAIVAVKRLVTRIGVAFGLAFLETLLMENPLIADVFCYDDTFLTLTFGSACYGISFFFCFDSWMTSVPEDAKRVSFRERDGVITQKPAVVKARWWRVDSAGGPLHAFAYNIGASLLTALALVPVRLYIAPLVTVVVLDSPPHGGCLLLYAAAAQ